MKVKSQAFVPPTARLGRRTFLKVGALALGGWSLADHLRLQAATGNAVLKDTAVIQIFMGGGPSHLDMYDLKPLAPSELRGEFTPISSAVPGCHFSEHLPRQAAVMDKLVIIKSLQHTNPSHLPASHWMLTGYEGPPTTKDNHNPAIGAVVSSLRGPNTPGLPGYVAMPKQALLGGSAYLGLAHNPFAPDSDPSKDDFEVKNLTLADGLSTGRLDERQGLRDGLDFYGQQLQASKDFDGLDRFSQQAYDMVTGERAAQAFDLSLESPELRERYGNHSGGQGCLLARRLVEAGVTFVTVLSGADWDTHTDNFNRLKNASLPKMDSAISALVTDLYERGLDKRVMVIAHGEFGRTPQINKDAGRDHWPGAACVLFSGGGISTGRMIGETDKRGAYPITPPYSPGDVLSTVYHFLGIDYHHHFYDQSGRIRPVLQDGTPIRELYT
ncbi:MAG: DUF1501 domain-containing protein [Planctomycetaceae bacterium]|nr:DUF1501 domain-containing protein [Planctomycetaceae bacterium]